MRLIAGTAIPEFTYNTADEQNLSFTASLKGSTVLWVLRYIGCPVCRLDIYEIMQNYERFKEKNAQVFVVLQSEAEHLKKELAETPVPFTIISDPDLKIYDLFEIRPAKSKAALAGTNLIKTIRKLSAAGKAGFKHGDYEGIEEQLPAMFIIDESGTVQYAHYAGSIADMPSVAEVLDLL